MAGSSDAIRDCAAWKHWRWAGSEFGQNSLGAYLTSVPPNGIGILLDTVEKLIADDPEALRLYRKETVGEKHVHADGYNVPIGPHRGNSRAWTLDKLQRKRPNLYAKVAAKEMSANKASIAAALADNDDVLRRYRQEMVESPGGDRQSGKAKSITDNISNALLPKHGTSRNYTLDRLWRERRDLYAKVVAKEMSANAAAIEAGWRKQPTPFDAIVKLLPKLTAAEKRELREML